MHRREMRKFYRRMTKSSLRGLAVAALFLSGLVALTTTRLHAATVVTNIPTPYTHHSQRTVYYNGNNFFVFYTTAGGKSLYARSSDTVAGLVTATEQTVLSATMTVGSGWNIHWVNDQKFDLVYVTGGSPYLSNLRTCTVAGNVIDCTTLNASPIISDTNMNLHMDVVRSGSNRVFVSRYYASGNLKLFAANQTGDSNGITTWSADAGMGGTLYKQVHDLVPYPGKDKALIVNQRDPGGAGSDGLWYSVCTYAGSLSCSGIASIIVGNNLDTNPNVLGSGFAISDSDFRFAFSPYSGFDNLAHEYSFNGASSWTDLGEIDPSSVHNTYGSLFYDRISSCTYAFFYDAQFYTIQRYRKLANGTWGEKTQVDDSEADANSLPVTAMIEPSTGSTRTSPRQMVWGYLNANASNFDVNVKSLFLGSTPTINGFILNTTSATITVGANGNPDGRQASISTGIAGNYNVARSSYGVFASNAAQLTIFGLSTNTIYNFQAAAVSCCGSTDTITVTGSTSTLAATPGVSTFSAVNISSITISWEPRGNPLTPPTSYQVQISTAGDFSIFTASETFLLSASTIALSHSTRYYFRVRAYGRSNDVTPFNETNSTFTLAEIVTPKNVEFTQVSTGGVSVSWTLNSGNSYQMAISTAINFGAMTVFGVGGSNQNTTSYTTLQPGTSYYFKVKISTDPDTNYSTAIATRTATPAVLTVKSGGGAMFTTIQDAVNAIPTSMSQHHTVLVQDAGPYNESVTVQGKTNNGYRITITSDTGLSDLPTVVSNTRAFDVFVASVSIIGFRINGTSSGDGVRISTGYFDLCGSSISGWTNGVYLSATPENVTVRNNFLWDNIKGIYLNQTRSVLISSNTIHGNGFISTTYGIYSEQSQSLLISSNTILDNGYGSTQYGIYLSATQQGTTVQYNHIVKNTYGIYSLNSKAGALVTNNRIYPVGDNQNRYGIYLDGSPNFRIKLNDIVVNASSFHRYGIWLTNTSSATNLFNNIILDVAASSSWDFYAIYIDDAGSQTDMVSNYNDINYKSILGSKYTGRWNSTLQASLADWQSASGLDKNSISADPLYFSTASVSTLDFHLKSPAGRWDPSLQDFVTTDASTSPAIDKGDPNEAYGNEPNPNGSRVNLGSYGNTPEASKTAEPPGGVPASNRVSIVETGQTFAFLNEALSSLANTKSPFTQNYTVRLSSGIYYETGAATSTINTGSSTLTVERDPGASPSTVTLSGLLGDPHGINQDFTFNSRVIVRNLTFQDYSGYGIFVTSGTVAISSVSIQSEGYGVYLYKASTGSSVSYSSITSNNYGIYANACKDIAISTNAILSAGIGSTGIYLNSIRQGTTVQNNLIADYTTGIRASNSKADALAAHNRIYGTQDGIYLDAAANFKIKFNDIVMDSVNGTRHGIYFVNNSSGTTITNNNVLDCNGSNSNVFYGIYSIGSTDVSDYNNIHYKGLGNKYIGSKVSSYITLDAWKTALGLDLNSISTDPLYFSTASVSTLDLHVKSPAGRWDPAEQSFVTTDISASPTIDRGDPAEPYDLEPNPNGSRVNIGSYGNTAEASKTPPPPPADRVRIVETAETFTYLDQALTSIATTRSPFSQDYTIRLSTGVYYETASDTNIINTNGFTLTIERELGVEASTVALSGVYGDINEGIMQSFTDGSRVVIRNLTFENYTGSGIRLSSGAVIATLSSNTVRNCGYGIYLSKVSSGTIVSSNTLTSNTYGIYLDTIQQGTTVQNNLITDSTYGLYANIAKAGAFVANNRIYSGTYNEARYGILLSNSQNFRIMSNDILMNSMNGARYGIWLVSTSTGTTIANNIISNSGSLTFVGLYFNGSANQTGTASNYNDVYGGNYGRWGGVNRSTLDDWQAASGQDAHSISFDPLYFSTASISTLDFHLKSPAGRWDPSLQDFVTTDTSTSPAIDKGDRSAPFGAEPSPNGDRINLGSYGNTAEASKTPPPSGGNYSGVRIVETAQTFTYLNQALSSLANTKSPFTQDYTVQVSSGIYYEMGAATSTIDTGASTLIIERDPGANPSNVAFSGQPDTKGIDLTLTPNSRVVIRNLMFQNYSDRGIQVTSGTVTIASNTVQNCGYGIYLNKTSTGSAVSSNTLSGNTYGIYLNVTSNGSAVSSNTLSGNTYGIYLNSIRQGTTVQNNTIVSNTYGIYSDSSKAGALVVNNRIYSDTDNEIRYGIYLTGSPNFRIKFNDIVMDSLNNSRYGIYLNNTSSGTSIANNVILDAAGSGSNLFYGFYFSAAGSQTGMVSNYNLIHYKGSTNKNIGRWNSASQRALSDWRIASNKDSNSIFEDPLYFSTASVSTLDYHVLSPMGRWNPATQGFDTTDLLYSPTVDAGDPAESSNIEPVPNGAQVNLGSYGNTPEASKSIARARNVAFYGVTVDSVSVNWDLNSGNSYTMVLFSTENLSVILSSATGAVGINTTSYANLISNQFYYFKVKISTEPDIYYCNLIATRTYRDQIRPSAVSDLTALTGINAGEIRLAWSAPGNDGTVRAFSGNYVIKYSSVGIINSTSFESPPLSLFVTTVTISTSNAAYGEPVGCTIAGLIDATTYWFAIKSTDTSLNTSVWKSSAEANVNLLLSTTTLQSLDTIAPSAISDLTALTGLGAGEINLAWSAPGNDQASNIFAGYYVIKYSSVGIINANSFDSPPAFLTVSSITISTSGVAIGGSVGRTITGLIDGTRYWFAIKSTDTALNTSVWNSSADVTTVNLLLSTTTLTPIPPAPTGVQFTQTSTGAASVSWTLNSGNSYLMAISTAQDFSVMVTSGAGSLDQNTTSYTTLQSDTSYYFKVKISSNPDAGYSTVIATRTAASAVLTVKSGGGAMYTTIQAAVNAIPTNMGSHYKILVQDVGPYNENVSVQGKINNGYRIAITSDPALADLPVVVGNTGAFDVKLASVSIIGFKINGSGSTFGVRTSSGNFELYGSSISGSSNGIYINATTAPVTVRNNTMLNNTNGIYATQAQSMLISSNTIQGSGTNIYGITLETIKQGTTVQNNLIIDNTYGIYANNSKAGALITNNRIYSDKDSEIRYGIYLNGSTNFRIKFNDIVMDSVNQNRICINFSNTSTGTIVTNNVIFDPATAGTRTFYGLYFGAGDNQSGTISNYNDICYKGSSNKNIGAWDGANITTLANWQSASGLDGNSISADPLYASLASLAALDLHMKSPAGRWDPAVQDFITTDTSTSPAIDKGDFTEPYGNEPEPNGSRANLGSYGNTAQASKSAQAQPAAGRVSIVETAQTFTYLNEALTSLANTRSPFTQDYTVRLSSGVYYETGSATSAINTNGFTLTIERDPSVNPSTVTLSGLLGDLNGINQPFTEYSRVVIRNLTFQNYSVSGIRVTSGTVTIASNTVQNNGGYGIYLSNVSTGSVISSNTIQSNANFTYGIYATACKAMEISSNTIQGGGGGSTYGIYLSAIRRGTTVQNNLLVDSSRGIYAENSLAGALIANNRIYSDVDANVRYGVYLTGSPNFTIKFNDILMNSLNNHRYGIYLTGTSSGTAIANNVILDAGDTAGGTNFYGIYLNAAADQTSTASNYNDVHYKGTDTKHIGFWASANQTTLANWQGASGLDGNSISEDPLYFSTESVAAVDFHVKSPAGRWNPASQSFVTTDFSTSPAIDAGDPAESYSAELAPNGFRVNQGSYGNRPEASKSVAGVRNVAFFAVAIDSVSVNWVLNAGNSYTMVFSSASDLNAILSSGTGALGINTTSYSSLQSNTTHYFKVKISTETDEFYSTLIATRTLPDGAAPNAISDLTGLTGGSQGEIYLAWSAPGNDGTLRAFAGNYVIKYSSVGIINAADFDNPPAAMTVNSVTVSTSGVAYGGAVGKTFTGLLDDTRYWFAIKSTDSSSNTSVWNSSADVTTVNLMLSTTTPSIGQIILTVKSGGGAMYNTIQGAVDAIPANMGSHYKVLVQDVGPYNENVSVQGKIHNGYRIAITSDPALADLPVVVGNTGAFDVKQASVSIIGFKINGTSSGFGVRISSGDFELYGSSISGSANGVYLSTTPAGVTVRNNSLLNNTNGIYATRAQSALISSNTIHGSGTNIYGIYLKAIEQGTTVQNNLILDNTYGVYALNSKAGALLTNNRIYSGTDNQIRYPIYLDGSPNFRIKFNDIVINSLNNWHYGIVLINTSSGTAIANNIILDAAESGSVFYGLWFAANADKLGTSSNYNNVRFINTGFKYFGYMLPIGTLATLLDWQNATGLDGNSISVDPMYFSTASAATLDFHVKSPAGRWDPGTQGFVTTDVSTSPTIDKGDPNEPYGNEPAPNGDRVNMGSYGNASEASKTITPPGGNPAAGRVSIVETAQTFTYLYQALSSIANTRSPFTQDYTVRLSSGIYYETGAATSAINTNGFTLTIERELGVDASTVTMSGELGDAYGINQPFSPGSRVIIRNLKFQNYSGSGIRVTSGTVILSSNTFLNNTYGITLNMVRQGTTVQNNLIADNTYGIYALNSKGGAFLANNRIYSDTDSQTRYGIYLDGSPNIKIKFNDIVVNSLNNPRYGVYLTNTSSGSTLSGNIILDAAASGSQNFFGAYFAAAADQTASSSNYNDIVYKGSSNKYTGYWASANRTTLANWQSASGQDANSISSDPLYFSTTSVAELDLHLKSPAGRWDPAIPGFVTTDVSTSPAIDRGDTAEPSSLEPTPNGERVNLGSYGNTAEASKSVSPQPVAGRVSIVETVDTFTYLGQALSFLANTKSPFTQNYTVRLTSGVYYESASATSAINTNGFTLTIERDPGASPSTVTISGLLGDPNGINQSFTSVSRVVIRNLKFQDFSAANNSGIRLSSGNVTLASNTFQNNYYGCYLDALSTASIVYANTFQSGSYGIYLNTIRQGSTVQNNLIADYTYGIYANASKAGALLANNRIYSDSDNEQRFAIYLNGSPMFRIKFNDIALNSVSNFRYGIYLTGTSSGTTIANNIISDAAAGGSIFYGLYFAAAADQTGTSSNYNDVHYNNSALKDFGLWDGAVRDTITEWRSASSQDANSISADPMYYSTASVAAFDSHLKSPAGRWDPASQGFVTTDLSTSPAIDAGDPSEAYGSELAPNGVRVNLGSYGNTPEASKSIAGVRDVRFFAVEADSASVQWVLNAGNSYTMVFSSMADLSVLLSSGTGGVGINTTSYAPLQPVTSYYFKVKISTESDDFYSTLITTRTPSDAIAPSAISDLTALTGTAAGEINLAWSAPGNDGAARTFSGSYVVKYSSVGIINAAAFDNPPAAMTVNSVTISTSGVAYGGSVGKTFTGLLDETRYWFAIKSTDNAQNTSVWNSSADVTSVNLLLSTVTPPPYSAPANVQYFSVIADSVSVSWDLSAGNQYVMAVSSESNFATIISSGQGILNQNATSYASLMSNTTYFFKTKVASYPDAYYNTAIATATWAAVPSTTPFTASDVWATSVTFNWLRTNNSTGTYYEAHVSTSDDFTLYSTSVPSLGALSITTATLTGETSYFFRVRARNYQQLLTNWSATASTMTRDNTPPDAVTDLSGLTGTLPGTIRLTWTPPGEDGSIHSLQPGSRFHIATTTVLSDAQNPNYWELKKTTAEVQLSTSNVTPQDPQSTILTGLQYGVIYYVRIWTKDPAGNWSALSNGATAEAQTVVLSVMVDSDTYNFGTFTAVQSSISARAIVVTNSGNVVQKYSIRATTATTDTPWALTESRGNDTIAVNALFNANRPADAEFEAVSSSLAYANQAAGSGGGKFAGDQTGVAVPISADRKLWFRLGMPLSTSTTDEQLIQVTVTAEQEP